MRPVAAALSALAVLAGTLYTNANGVLNDGVYEYDTLALPFRADLGEVLARELLLEPEDR